MKYKKSYTNKWLNHYHKFWHEEQLRDYFKMIVIDKADAPKIVKERVNQINMRRYEKNAQYFFVNGYSLNVFAKACKRAKGKSVSINLFTRVLDDEKAREDRYWEKLKITITPNKEDNLPIIHTCKEYGDKPKTNEKSSSSDNEDDEAIDYDEYDRYYADED